MFAVHGSVQPAVTHTRPGASWPGRNRPGPPTGPVAEQRRVAVQRLAGRRRGRLYLKGETRGRYHCKHRTFSFFLPVSASRTRWFSFNFVDNILNSHQLC